MDDQLAVRTHNHQDNTERPNYTNNYGRPGYKAATCIGKTYSVYKAFL